MSRLFRWLPLILVLASVLIGAGFWARSGNVRRVIAPPSASPPVLAVVPPSGPIQFQDVTRESGVDFLYRNGEEAGLCVILESLGGGVGMFDFDGDGRLDLF